MSSDIEAAVRDRLAQVLGETAGLELDGDMAVDYGLTSLNKVVFLTSVCDDTGVDPASFTEQDLAGLVTMHDVVGALASRQQRVTA